MLLLYWGVSTWIGMFTSRNQRLADLKTKVGDKERTMLQVKQAIVRRSELEKRSLPTDRELARSLYHKWIVSTMEGSKLEDINVGAQGHFRRLEGVCADQLYCPRAGHVGASHETLARLLLHELPAPDPVHDPQAD